MAFGWQIYVRAQNPSKRVRKAKLGDSSINQIEYRRASRLLQFSVILGTKSMKNYRGPRNLQWSYMCIKDFSLI